MLPRFNSTTPKQYTSISQIEKTNPGILDEERQKEVREIEKQNEELLAITDDPNPLKDITKGSNKLSAPHLLLSGHQREVLSAKFSPNGQHIASVGFDKNIFVWDVYNDCENSAMIKAHKNAILEIHWASDNSKLYTCSADKTAGVWDFETLKRVKKCQGHTSFVNSCSPARRGEELLVTGSDDCTVKIWDMRHREAVHSFQQQYQVTAVAFSELGDKVFTAGIDNQIKVWDVRKGEVEYVLYGHTDTITGLSLSPEGSFLLSNAVDQTVRCWDIKSFVMGNRCVKIFQGNAHGYEKNLLKCSWSSDGSLISAGSADKYTYLWDTTSRKIAHQLGGHNGSVNEVHFSPTDNLLVSASSDKTLIVSEIPE